MFAVDESYPLAIEFRMLGTAETSLEGVVEALRIAIHRFAMPLTTFQRINVVHVGEDDPEYIPGIIQLLAHIPSVTKQEFRTMGHVEACMISYLMKERLIRSPLIALTHLTDQCDVDVVVVFALRQLQNAPVRFTNTQRDLIIEDFNAAQARILDTLEEMFDQTIDPNRVGIEYDTLMHKMTIRCPFDKILSRNLKATIGKAIEQIRQDLSLTSLRFVGLGYSIYSPGEITRRSVLSALKARAA